MDRAKRESLIREARKPKAPKDLEVENKNTRIRVILLIASVLVAVIAIGVGIYEAFTTDPGVQLVESVAETYHCGADFEVRYNYGASGMDPTDEEKAVQALYTQASVDAYEIFYEGGQLEQIVPGEQVQIDPALYAVLEQIQSYGNRTIYYAPVFAEYDRMFLSGNAQEASWYDPMQNPEQAEYVSALTKFAKDPAMVDLELLGESTVCLQISEEYLAFAREYEIETFLSLGWMRNAFVADYLAQRFQEAGHTHVVIASYDGYTRSLETANILYSQNIFDRLENSIYMPGAMEYSGTMSIVIWRNYPMSASSVDRWHYFDFGNGRIASVYLDPTDGKEKSATDNLISYSTDRSCGQILLETAPLFLADTLDEAGLYSMSQEGLHSLWFEGTKLKKTDPALSVRANTATMDVTYDMN